MRHPLLALCLLLAAAAAAPAYETAVSLPTGPACSGREAQLALRSGTPR